ncbi:homocysteine S-methyltransferase [Nocardioides scoriae]|uniref:Homocysteine S-methyltransferase n=1 Tax=Nocardioides scoriae TaxID=642780 RepID=A0A1H1NFJ9_9ACTN|nr:homocysteine S-methyltransferase family protein [Nocardioides scoriae]SDR97744.1 homocysteine S-methyltransferase [Nocardioides scoriae]
MGAMRLTDGGLETTLIFERGLELPLFAAFPLVEDDAGRAVLAAYWQPFLDLAESHGVGFDVDTATWRANPDWASQLGYDAARLRAVNEEAAGFARSLGRPSLDVRVNGVVGPRGDGYVSGEEMGAEEAAAYHLPQVRALAAGGVDQVSALTLTYPREAVGFLHAAGEVGLPALVSFTVETDGRLPNGTPLADAVAEVEDRTARAAVGYLVNCAHPTHLDGALTGGPWTERVVGVRANASTMSHAELDAAEELDPGDPDDLARRYVGLVERLPGLRLLGGCCGTDLRHVGAIAAACLS